MLLKSIELQGYKTFAGRTSFEFAGAITCIVGPNGSGKSNIADAIRWVLGEQSYRLLRGKKTEDMIFSGSESRSRAGMASANIIFDNTSGWLPVDFSEVSIARRAYRDGTNEYLLNGQRVRLKDITELLASSGLSERTYTIIGQGLVDAALALRAEDRRRLFEEAAGIGLHRARREESLRRLEATYRNIERAEDIMAELRPRLRSLERQARRANQFEQVEKDLKALLQEYYGYHWYQAQRELNQARETARVQEAMYEAVFQEQSDLDQQLSTYREEIQSLRARLASWHRESSSLHNQLESITREQAVSDERVRSLNSQDAEAQDELARISDQIQFHQDKLQAAERETERLLEELDEARSQKREADLAYQARQAEREQGAQQVNEIRRKLNEQQDRYNLALARLGERKIQNERLQANLESGVETIASLEEETRQAETRLAEAQSAGQQVGATRRTVEQELEDLRARLDELTTQKQNLVDQKAALKAELARFNAQLEVLEQAERALSGYASGTQLLLKSAQQGKLGGTHGALSTRLEVHEAYEPAIVAALGEYLDAVLLEGVESSDVALEILVQQTTRGSILPLSFLKPPTPVHPPALPGVLGVASEMVQCPPELRPAVDLLLGQTLVVEDRQAARVALRDQPATTRAVTRKGELFYASGPISVGQRGESSTISRPRQRRELGEQIKRVQESIASLETKAEHLETTLARFREDEAAALEARNQAVSQEKTAQEHLNQVTLETERLRRQSQWQKQQFEALEAEIHQGEAETRGLVATVNDLEEAVGQMQEQLRNSQTALANLSLDENRAQVSYWHTQVAVAEQALVNAQTRASERAATLDEVKRASQSLQARLNEYRHKLDEITSHKIQLRAQEDEIGEKIEALRVLIDPAETELRQFENEHDRMQDTEAQARQGLSLADRRHSQAQLTLTRKQERLDTLRERIEDDLGLTSFEYDAEISGPKPLPFGEMVQQLHRVDQLTEGLEDNIKRQRAQLRRMGLINPEAQAEYKEVKERYEFMTSQIEDLRKAERDIKNVVTELDDLMELEFNRTFEKVAAEFREIFTRLFGGGSAYLVLTDPNDLTGTGIEIEARLPGRRSQGLSLLSGGERSLTAAALVFSLLKVSPTPFCVLDEVDAMLDEANVGRFRELLRELAENTQFIVITHNRNTVQAADVIYGVTMGRDSASQMISLKLDEVSEIV